MDIVIPVVPFCFIFAKIKIVIIQNYKNEYEKISFFHRQEGVYVTDSYLDQNQEIGGVDKDHKVNLVVGMRVVRCDSYSTMYRLE